jgi:molecular chaperone DnaK (HSP70)
MEASINTGLVTEDEDKSLFFALEPEAASFYCSKNQDIDQDLLKKGECYIICDLGGGTGDIVAYLIGENYSLKEIYPASGGDYGSDKINKRFFEDIIYEIFDCKDFNTFYKKYTQLNKNGEDEGTLFNE